MREMTQEQKIQALMDINGFTEAEAKKMIIEHNFERLEDMPDKTTGL
jgi:hypothetical protein